MSHVEKISDELRAVTAGLDLARSSAASTDSQAQEIGTRAAMTGFTGVAVGINQIREAISGIQASLATAHNAGNEASATASTVAPQPSPEEVIARLSPLAGQTNTIQGAVTATIAKITEAQQLVHTVMRGGHPGTLLSSLGSIRQILDQVFQRAQTVEQLIRSAVGEAQQVGESGK